MDAELEKALQGQMPDAQWQAFKAECIKNEIPMDEDALEYGSLFISFKYWFDMGWEACANSTGK